jgi:hypothetical protein
VKTFWLYTLARTLLFAATWGVIWLVAMTFLSWNTYTALGTAMIAMVASAFLSLFLLSGLRDQLSERVAASARRFEAARRKEDQD